MFSTFSNLDKISSMAVQELIMEEEVTDKYLIGARIKKIREEKHISQKGLAERVGIVNVRLSDYERGRLRVPSELLIRFAQALEVSADELLGIDDHLPPSANLYRRFKKIESLPTSQQKIILENLDIFLRGLHK